MQGKAAAADQPVSSMANLVPAVVPQPMFKPNLEAGIKAAMAEKAKELKQKGLDQRHRNLSAEVTRHEGQVLHLFLPSCKMLPSHLLLCFLSCPDNAVSDLQGQRAGPIHSFYFIHFTY